MKAFLYADGDFGQQRQPHPPSSQALSLGSMRLLLMDAAWMLGSRPSMTESGVHTRKPFTAQRPVANAIR
jgi:hypothetical protein